MIEGLKKCKQSYIDVKIDSELFTDAWFSGFVDAEGCVLLGKNGTYPKLEVAQISSPQLLDALKIKYGGTCKPQSKNERHPGLSGYLNWHGPQALKMFKMILPYAVVKRSQLVHVLGYLEEREAERKGKKWSLLSNERKLKDKAAGLKCSELKYGIFFAKHNTAKTVRPVEDDRPRKKRKPN